MPEAILFFTEDFRRAKKKKKKVLPHCTGRDIYDTHAKYIVYYRWARTLERRKYSENIQCSWGEILSGGV